MKTITLRLFIILLMSVLLSGLNLWGDVPHFRGKVVLVMDHTMATNPAVDLTRLKNDLAGDGWHVLALDVTRGLSPGDPNWFATNGPEVRQVRALIQADYNAAPSDVKQVFLIGHVPVAYSGYDADIVGDHYAAAEPADLFYGEMDSKYWTNGWSDNALTPFSTNAFLNGSFYFTNYPSDGVFDPTTLPSPMELGVGRVDFQGMPNLDADEVTVMARYLNKDHDFRQGNFQVQRKAYNLAEYYNDADHNFQIASPGLNEIFGSDNVASYVSGWFGWFPNVSQTNYLIGYAGGYGGNDTDEAVGMTFFNSARNDTFAIECSTNNFMTNDSQVVFVNLYGSFFGNWEQTNDFLRAPLANPYDPAHGRHGLGLTAFWGAGYGLDEYTLTNRALGATIGEALFQGYSGNVNFNLMGDPTLRLYTVLPPTTLAISNAGPSLYLHWSASTDTNVLGYNVYSAPTDNGPYSLRNTSGPVTTPNYVLTRATNGVPDNFYMVRTVKWEETPAGSYTNMSEGMVVSNAVAIPYLSIISEPVASGAVVDTDGYSNNAAAFTVDAAGITTNGNETLTYQWYKDGTALTDDGHIHGATTRALLIINVQTNDMGSYTVVVGLADGSISTTSTSGGLTVAASNPTATADSFTVTRHVATDLNVLANDTSTMISPAMMITSISALSKPSAGTITINSGGASVHFVPSESYLGTVTFTYVMTDGCGLAQATATMNVVPHSDNTPPAVSAIADQTVMENTTMELPFTVIDDYSSADAMAYVVTCSNPEVIPNYNLSTFGTGSSRMLQIIGGANRIGTTTITLQVTDEDLGTTTESFDVTILPDPNLPQLSGPDISSNTFSFWITGPANSYWNVYSSTDLTNWTQIGGITLNAFGTNIFTDNTIAGVTNRIYKLSNGNECSQAIGFERIIAHPGQSLIANQFDAFTNNTLNTVFDFTTVPNLTVVQKWNGNGYDYYTNVSGIWLPNGNATAAPGEGVFFVNPATNDCLITFVGLVREGSWSLDLPRGNSCVASVIPLAGGVISVLNCPFQPNDGLLKLSGTAFVSYVNASDDLEDYPTGWIGDDGVTSVAEPNVRVGEGFFFQNTTAPHEYWAGSYSACGGNDTCTVPTPTNCVVSTNSFTFKIVGAANSYWNVYSSTDLTNWTQIGGITLNAFGTNFFTDTTIAGVTNRVYKLSNGSCCSQAVGFERIIAHSGQSLIANQFDMAPDNTLNSIFTFTTVPNLTVVKKWDGVNNYNYYTNVSGVWLPNGNATVAPGESVFFVNPTGGDVLITFGGLVHEGSWTVDLPAGRSCVASVIPIGGGAISALNCPLQPNDSLLKWSGTDFIAYVDASDDLEDYPTGWADGVGNPTSEPTINVGEGFFIQTSSHESWAGSYSGCGGNDNCMVPILTNCVVTTNTFTFKIIGTANSYWNVYSSTDLTNWTQIGGITLNAFGTNFFTDTTIAGVTNRIYKLSNDGCCSQAVGFERIIAHHGTNFVANQFDMAPDNTLNSVFTFTTVPNLTVVRKWNGNGYDYYTNVSGVWLPNGNATAAPGEGFFFDNPASNNVVVTFAGLVHEGSWSLDLPTGYSCVGSIIPNSGGITSILGYQPNDSDAILKWNGTSFDVYTHDSEISPTTGWTGNDGVTPVAEPVINIGEGFFIENNTTPHESWTGSYSACH